jgi:hypothetical protein
MDLSHATVGRAEAEFAVDAAPALDPAAATNATTVTTSALAAPSHLTRLRAQRLVVRDPRSNTTGKSYSAVSDSRRESSSAPAAASSATSALALAPEAVGQRFRLVRERQQAISPTA